jgi:penicillin amidase
MRWLKRLVLAVLAIFVGLPLAYIAILWAWLSLAAPGNGGALTLPSEAGLQGEVEIRFGPEGVPTVRAAGETDAAFALGYLHARERLWQMETTRRTGQGRLAEIFGGAVVGFDKLMRTLNLYRLAETDYAALSPDARAMMDSYTRGVNAYLQYRSEPLPLEFHLFFVSPEPWKPADSLVWARLMALQLSSNYRQELQRAQLLTRLSTEQVNDLLNPPTKQPVTLPERFRDRRPIAASSETKRAAVEREQRDYDAALQSIDWAKLADLFAPLSLGPNNASNAWIIPSDMSETGKPLLVNDPHLGLSAPILWYLARIELPDRTMAGATVPGIPLHILGQNGTIAWGFTTTGSDTQDLFIEKIDETDPSRYITPFGPRSFETRVEKIKVRFGESVRMTVRSSRHGPVISDIDEAARAAAGPGHVIALSFTGLAPNDTSAEAIYRINRAKDWDSFLSALRFYGAPQQNMFYADVNGNVGFIAPGLVPIRAPDQPGIPGSLPAAGWTGQQEWIGMIPFEDLPRTYNPWPLILANGNNAIVDADYPYFIAADWEAPYRGRRIAELIGAREKHDAANMEAMLMDPLSLDARDLVPLLASQFDPYAEVPGIDLPAGYAAKALDRLMQWDFTFAREKPEPLIYTVWLRELQLALYGDELGPDFMARDGIGRPDRVEHMLIRATRWCDDVTTGDRAETCAEIVGRAFASALRQLRDAYGDDIDTWRWGKANVAPLAHQVLGNLPAFGGAFRMPQEIAGSSFTLNRAGARIHRGTAFEVGHGAGYRAVYDLSNLDNSEFVIATGQSGNPFSRHWNDLAPVWASGGHITLGPSKADAERLILKPQVTGKRP